MRNDAIYWAIAREHAANVFAAEKPEIRALAETDANPTSLITTIVNRCAVISISGALEKETWIGSRTGILYILGYDLIRQALTEALANPLVASILLSIDSPGGIVQGTKELADYIAEVSQIKPIAAYADGLCASAAYWLAAATGRIYAPATALVGSIGVIMRVENWTGFYTRAGVQIEYIASGKFKAAGQDAKELSEEERQYFSAQLAELHNIFREDVRKSMSITSEDALWAEAQLMPATQAINPGLVTQIVRDREEAISLLATSMEDYMTQYTYEALQQNAPELLGDIETKAQAKGREAALACVKIICGEEAFASCEKMLADATELGLSATQMTAFAKHFPRKAEAAADPRLQAIIEAHEPPLAQDAPAAAQSSLVADAERRATLRSNK